MDSRIKDENRDLSLESTSDDPASLSLIEKYDLFLNNNLSEDSDEETEEIIKNQMKNYANCAKTDNNLIACFSPKPTNINIDEPLEQLTAIRKTGEDGNSIFCTSAELEKIQERYEEILGFIANFVAKNADGSAKKQDESKTEALIEKIKSVQEARDKLYDVENQVREQIEQLELVERYKMED